MKIRDIIFRRQRDSVIDKHKEARIFEEELQQMDAKRELARQERWEDIANEIRSTTLSEYSLIEYRVATTKYGENYIVALKIDGDKLVSCFNAYAISSVDIYILGENYKEASSAEYMEIDICEKKVLGQAKKYIFISDVRIFGSQGRGSIAMESLISFAKENDCSWIEGWRKAVDEKTEEDKTRRDNYYKKYDFSFEGDDGRLMALRL